MRTLRRALLVAAALTLAAPFGPAPAVASCVQETAADQAARADVIVVGTVIQTRQTFAAASGVIGFRPERVLKGTLTAVVQVYLGPTHGGAPTSVDYVAVIRGEQHTLYLRAVEDGSYETNACSGSHTGGPTADEVRTLGAGTLVVAASDDAPAPAVIAGIAVLLAVAAIAILIAVRRRVS